MILCKALKINGQHTTVVKIPEVLVEEAERTLKNIKNSTKQAEKMA